MDTLQTGKNGLTFIAASVVADTFLKLMTCLQRSVQAVGTSNKIAWFTRHTYLILFWDGDRRNERHIRIT